jgi:hypothetical protein
MRVVAAHGDGADGGEGGPKGDVCDKLAMRVLAELNAPKQPALTVTSFGEVGLVGRDEREIY